MRNCTSLELNCDYFCKVEPIPKGKCQFGSFLHYLTLSGTTEELEEVGFLRNTHLDEPNSKLGDQPYSYLLHTQPQIHNVKFTFLYTV